MKQKLFSLLLIVFILACGAPSAESIQQAIAQTQAAAVTPTPNRPNTPKATATRRPTSTPRATEAPVGDFFAWNDVATIESGGLSVNIARLALADKTAVDDPKRFDALSMFDDRPVVAVLVYRLQNTTDKTISIFPEQATVIAGDEQIDLSEFMFGGMFGDDVGGDIFPGVTKVGGIWFGFKRTAIDAIQNMTIVINAPFNTENFSALGPEIRFELDLSERKNEPVPPELNSLK